MPQRTKAGGMAAVWGLGVLLIVGLVSCGPPVNPDPYHKYFKRPSPPKEWEFSAFEKVVTTETEGAELRGYVRKESLTLQGVHEPREVYFIYDTTLERRGFVMEDGLTYRYTPSGERLVGTFLLDTAARVLLRSDEPLRVLPYDF